MKELQLKYGCNPNQKPSRIYMQEGELPIEVLCGKPGYINFLDALNGWQLVRELKKATGLPPLSMFLRRALRSDCRSQRRWRKSTGWTTAANYPRWRVLTRGRAEQTECPPSVILSRFPIPAIRIPRC